MAVDFKFQDMRGAGAAPPENHLDRMIITIFRDAEEAGTRAVMLSMPCFSPDRPMDELVVRESCVLGVMRTVEAERLRRERAGKGILLEVSAPPA